MGIETNVKADNTLDKAKPSVTGTSFVSGISKNGNEAFVSLRKQEKTNMNPEPEIFNIIDADNENYDLTIDSEASIVDKVLNIVKSVLKDIFGDLFSKIDNYKKMMSNIEKIEKCGVNSENIQIVLKNGDKFILDSEYRVVFAKVEQNEWTYCYDIQDTKKFDVNGIVVEQSDIKKEVYKKPSGETLVVMKNGDTYLFDMKNRIIEVKTEEYEIHYDYDSELKEFYGLTNIASIQYTAKAIIRGHEINYYSLGDSTSNKDACVPINFSNQYQKFPDSILEEIAKSFFSVVIGDKSISLNNPLNGNYGAYVHYDEQVYMFVPNNHDLNSSYYQYNTPLHEGAHVIQFCCNIDEEKLKSLFETYKNLLPQLKSSCYNVNIDYEESPNYWEFFADAVVNYYLNPDELKRYIPEVYQYIDSIFNEMGGE